MGAPPGLALQNDWGAVLMSSQSSPTFFRRNTVSQWENHKSLLSHGVAIQRAGEGKLNKDYVCV